MARLLLWSTAFWPLIGGVEVLGERTLRELSKRGHEFTVITDRPVGVDKFSHYHGVDIHRLDMTEAMCSGEIDRWLEVRARVSAIKRDFKPDLVWSYLLQPDSMFHLMSEPAYPTPTLVTVHGTYGPGSLEPGSAVRQLLERAIWVSACSQHSLTALTNAFPALHDRSSVILNGLEMPSIDPSPLPFRVPRLLCMGRIGTTVEKGFDLAIDAMVSITRIFPDARLLIAGDGAARAELEEHAANKAISYAVDFLGWIHPDSVYALINGVTMLLVPSRVPEGFGLSALQAQQMARPVVAVRTGGLPEVVIDGETGVLVNSGDSEQLAKAVVELLTNPHTAVAMGNAARARAQRDFQFSRYADEYDVLIRALVGANSNNSPVVSS